MRIDKTQNTDNSKCWEDVEKQELSSTAGGNTDTLEDSLAISYKSKHTLTTLSNKGISYSSK
jgi:hypothetical protein